MYHQIVRRIIRQSYAHISQANFEPVLAQFAPDIHFTFAGQHALTAAFHNRDCVRDWFHRLHRLFPGFQIRPERITVSGFPWNTMIAVEFTVEDTLPDGTAYFNRGIQVVRLVWGRAVEDYLIDDSQLLADTLHALADAGLAEAAAAPLQDR